MKNRLECMQPIRFLVVLLMCCLSYTTWAQTQSNVMVWLLIFPVSR